MTFNFPVMDEKVKPHQVTTLHMVAALAFIVTGSIIVIYNYTIPFWGAAILVAGVALTIAVIKKNKWVIRDKINPGFRIAELIIAGSIAAYSAIQHWKFPTTIFSILSAALLFAIWWERPSENGPSVGIDDEGVHLPFAARRKLKPWTEVEEVIYRFGTLTINFTDNTFIQWETLADGIDNTVLENYCYAQIEENRSKRRKDDW